MNQLVKRVPENVIKLVLPVLITIAIVSLMLIISVASDTAFNASPVFGYGEGPGVTSTPSETPVSSSGSADVSGSVDSSGKFKQNVVVVSADSNVSVNIPQGVVGTVGTGGAAISAITVVPVANPPAPPANSNFIGIPYDLGPAGAVFNPAITVSFDISTLPAGTNLNDLKVAFYNQATGTWVELTNITIDPATGKISGQTTHFTTFSVIVKKPAAPAPTTTTAPVTTAPAPTQTSVKPTATQPAYTGPVVITATNTVSVGEIKSNWTLVIVIAAIAVVVFGIFLPIYFRKRRD